LHQQDWFDRSSPFINLRHGRLNNTRKVLVSPFMNNKIIGKELGTVWQCLYEILQWNRGMAKRI